MMLRFRFPDGLFSLILLPYLTLSVLPAFSSAALYVGAALVKSSKLDESEDILLLMVCGCLDSIVTG